MRQTSLKRFILDRSVGSLEDLIEEESKEDSEESSEESSEEVKNTAKKSAIPSTIETLSIDEFDYTLPESQIAQAPLSNRENSNYSILANPKQISRKI